MKATSYTPSIDLNSLRIAAIRETWEEVGVLLANGIIPRETKDFLFACKQLNIRPAIEKLYYFSRIITPLNLPKRFDTTFFLSIEGNQEVVVDNYEADQFVWNKPDFFLNEFIQKRIVLLPPQIYILKQLSMYQNLTEVITGILSNPRIPFLAQLINYDGPGTLSVLPGDFRHDLTPNNLKAENAQHYICMREQAIDYYQSPIIKEYLKLYLER